MAFDEPNGKIPSDIQEKRYSSRIQDLYINHPSLAILKASSMAFEKLNCWRIISSSDPFAQYLDALSQTVGDLLYVQNDLAHPLVQTHISSDFVEHQDGRRSRSLEEHIAICRKGVHEVSQQIWEALETVVELHENESKARLWNYRRSRGWTAGKLVGMSEESVAMMEWEWDGQVWVCKRLRIMNGFPRGA